MEISYLIVNMRKIKEHVHFKVKINLEEDEKYLNTTWDIFNSIEKLRSYNL